MLDILMVTYKSESFEKAALDSLRAKTDVSFRLSVFDNNLKNHSITKIWNEFAKQSTADFLCYVNPDIVCGARWASQLLRTRGCPW